MNGLKTWNGEATNYTWNHLVAVQTDWWMAGKSQGMFDRPGSDKQGTVSKNSHDIMEWVQEPGTSKFLLGKMTGDGDWW